MYASSRAEYINTTPVDRRLPNHCGKSNGSARECAPEIVCVYVVCV